MELLLTQRPDRHSGPRRVLVLWRCVGLNLGSPNSGYDLFSSKIIDSKERVYHSTPLSPNLIILFTTQRYEGLPIGSQSNVSLNHIDTF